ncbi:MAG: hypothetical protein ABIH23_01090 [bacterium]
MTCALVMAAGQILAASVSIDPLTRYAHIKYTLPPDIPDTVEVVCTWSPVTAKSLRPAKVMPNISETALKLVSPDDGRAWVTTGRIIERGAAGLERTIIFNPYPDAQQDGKVDVLFIIEVRSMEGRLLPKEMARVQCDNTDVFYIEDWSGVTTQDAISPEEEPGKWTWRANLDAEAGVTFGNALYGNSGPERGLPPLSYPLSLKGPYAVFVCSAPSDGGIKLRLTGDERSDSLASRMAGEEVLWRWTRMDRQHLVLNQPCDYTGYTPGHIDYVKFVPLTEEQVEGLDAQFGGEQDKIVAGYFEPYSWAFADNICETLQHRAPLTAYIEARVPIVDIQIGRFGMKVVYESRLTDQLLHATIGDPIGKIVRPKTDNVGRMQQYTNTLSTELRYARELGLKAHANFGASNCYPGSPLQGDFSKEHPDWMRGSALRFEVPEVRQYALSLYREALEIGARGISIDFCRYPETIDSIETCNDFLKDLRALADEFAASAGVRIPILVRFPGTGVRRAEFFDYAAWAREGWVDYLCPSNIQGRHMHIDMAPYFNAVKGTTCTLLPCVDGLSWGLPFPGAFLWRIAQLYKQGASGVYIYQADARVLGQPVDRRTMRLLASSAAVERWWAKEDVARPSRSKGIYITPPHQFGTYHKWERIRIWTEGVPLGELEVYLDDKLVSRFDGPPYLVGTEEYASDEIIPPGDHRLRIRARDDDGWLEQVFAIKGG